MKNRNSNKKTKKIIFSFFAFLIVILNISTFPPQQVKAEDSSLPYCFLCEQDKDGEYYKEVQFVNKIKIIKGLLGSQIDEVVLAATVLHKYSALEVIDEQYDENFNENEYKNFWTDFLADAKKFTDGMAGKTNKDIKNEQIDLLTAATIVMVDSSGLGNPYDEEKYKKALAGSQLVGDDTPFGQGFNLFVCVAGGVADTLLTPFEFASGIFTGDSFEDTTKRKLTRYTNMGNICTNGYIGGIYDGVKDIENEKRKQARKDQIAQEIIDLANYYKSLRGNVSSSTEGNVCYYKVPGIDEEVYNVKVQTLRCEYGNDTGKVGDPITGEGLVDFENDYIPGVVYGEVGNGSLAETQKSQAVFARSYALTRGNAMNGAYGIGLSIEGGQWVLKLRNCTSDQAYCHIDKGCGTLSGGTPQGSTLGGPTLYAGGKGTGLYKDVLPADDPLRTNVAETKGKVAVDAESYVQYTPFASNEQNSWASLAASGKNYLEIVKGTTGHEVKSDCRGGGNYDLEAYYNASNAATESSNRPSADLAATQYKTVEGFNQHIKDKVQAAGYGTREAVVAAGIALIGDYIMDTGKRLRYDQGRRQAPQNEGIVNDDLYMDCSSFAWWALYNAGFKLPSYAQTGSQLSWSNSKGYTKDINSGKAGDFLISNGHIALIIGTYDGGYYVAEFINWGDGAIINKYGTGGWSTSSYSVIDMDAYYSDASNRR